MLIFLFYLFVLYIYGKSEEMSLYEQRAYLLIHLVISDNCYMFLVKLLMLIVVLTAVSPNHYCSSLDAMIKI